MFKKWLCAATFSAVALLTTPGVSSAQQRVWGGGWGSGWWGGNTGRIDGARGVYGSPYYSTYGYRPSYFGYGYSPYYYGYRMPYASSYSTPYYYGTPYSYNYGSPAYGYIPSSAAASYYYSPSDTSTGQNPNVALIEVRVPEDAELWFDLERMNQTGAQRLFRSPELQPGKSYTYDVRARWTDAAGKEVERIKQVKVQAGARVSVDFNNP